MVLQTGTFKKGHLSRHSVTVALRKLFHRPFWQFLHDWRPWKEPSHKTHIALGPKMFICEGTMLCAHVVPLSRFYQRNVGRRSNNIRKPLPRHCSSSNHQHQHCLFIYLYISCLSWQSQPKAAYNKTIN